MESLTEFFNDMIMFANDILDFRHWGIYEFFKKFFAEFVINATIALIKFKLFMMTFAYDVAIEILDQLDFSTVLANAWGSLSAPVTQLLGFFKIPEAINIILSAKVTKFVLKFMGM